MKRCAWLLTVAVQLALTVPILCSAQNPSDRWMRYERPEDAGWSAELLTNICQNSNASSVFLVHDGKVVFAYGQYGRRFKIHSIRKSLLSALYGLGVQDGKINLARTLEELNITETVPLTPEEKRARVLDLLKSRSGVYVPASAESEDMRASRPQRGSHPAGTHWYYNNWDFNVLGTIFNQETKEDIFRSFEERLARPLGMEDFRRLDGCFNLEPVSSHPAYSFKMSARDLARFGQLYLQEGMWNGRQVLNRDWIKDSTRPHSDTKSQSIATGDGLGYGYLWWVVEPYRSTRMFYAAGHYGQRLCVFPDLKTIVVLQSDSYIPDSVLDVDFVIDDLVFKARVVAPAQNPRFRELETPRTPSGILLDERELQKYCRDYTLDAINFSIQQREGHPLLLNYHFCYPFRLVPVDSRVFYIEDLDQYLFFEFDDSQNPVRVDLHKSPAAAGLHTLILQRGMAKAVEEAARFKARLASKDDLGLLAQRLDKEHIDNLEILKLNALWFPYSYPVQQQFSRALLKRQGLSDAAEEFGRMVEALRSEGTRDSKTEWFYGLLKAQASPLPLDESEIKNAVGDYGPRHIVTEGGVLYYYRDNPENKVRLYKISKNEFALKDLYHLRLGLEEDGRGKVAKLVLRYYRDSREESLKDR